jgi:hypothetical protein
LADTDLYVQAEDRLSRKIGQAVRGEDVPLSKVEQRIRHIEQLAQGMGLNPTKLPDGAKQRLRKLCLKDPVLFTESTFKKAWNTAGPRLRMAKHSTYSGRR